MGLVRVQVLIDDEENEALRCEARRLGVSRSEVVRRALRPLAAREAELADGDAFLEATGSFSGGEPRDVARNHDTYLYGRERR